MPITAVQEKDSATLNSATIPYYVRDDSATLTKTAAVNEAIAQSVLDGVGAVTDYQYKQLGDKVARVTLQQRPLQLGQFTPPSIGTVETGFDFAMGPIERRVGISRVRVYGRASMDDFGGAINVPSGYENTNAYGVRLPPPPQKFWFRWTGAASQLSTTYVKTVAGLLGTVNNATYKTYPAGTLCLVRASGTLRDDDSASLYFGWGYQPNVTDESWGSFIISYGGFEYPWSYNDNILLGSAGEKILGPEITGVYVDQILPTADHTGLNIP